MPNIELSVAAPYRFRKPSGFIIDENFNYSDGALGTVSGGFWNVFSGGLNVVSSRLDNSIGSPPRTQPTNTGIYTIKRNVNFAASITLPMTNVGAGTNGFTVGFRNRPGGGEFACAVELQNNAGTYIVNRILNNVSSLIGLFAADGTNQSWSIECNVNGANYDYFVRQNGAIVDTQLAAFTVDASLDRWSPFLTAAIGTAITPRGLDRAQWSTPGDQALT